MTRSTVRELAVLLCYTAELSKDTAETVLDNFFIEGHFSELASEHEILDEKPSKKQMNYLRTVLEGVCEKKAELDEEIDALSTTWRAGRLTKTALSILRCALYEIKYIDDVPFGVSVNEAVEIAKKYEDPETVSFINGVLGAFLKLKND